MDCLRRNKSKVCDVEKLSKAMDIIVQSQTDIINVAASDMASCGAIDFVVNKVKNCFKIVSAYRKAFQLAGVSNLNELDQVSSHFFGHEVIRDKFEDRLCNEDKFDAKGWKIVIVSFGARQGAEKWLEETNCPFEMVVDEQRKIYRAFGLYRSVAKVWNFGYMAFYAEQMNAGRHLPKPYENIFDDPIQMGGDFLLDSNGIVLMVHPSEVPTDRPSICDLLAMTAN